MIDRCRNCGHEEARGCLPAVNCGLYLIFLLALSVGSIAGIVHGLHLWIGEPSPAAESIERPWWFDVGALAVGFTLVIIGSMAINFVLELVEYLAFAARRCPNCGRRWSWGFTRGFGL